MPIETLIKEIKALVASAQEKKALEKLLQFFSADKKYDYYEKSSSALLRRLNEVEKYSRLNLLTFGEISRTKGKINLRILELLDNLADGKTPPENDKKYAVPAPRWAGILASYLSVLVTIVGLIINYTGSNKVAENYCPSFEQNTYPILLFPFNAIESSGEFKPEVAISKRLKQYLKDSVKNTTATTIETYKKSIVYHGNDTTIIDLAQECDAKLVIWGEYINTPQEKIIYPHFAFTDQIAGSAYNPDEASFMITGLKDIIDGSLAAKDMETWLFKLFSLVIQLSQNMEPHKLISEANQLLAMSPDTSSKLIALAVRSKALYQLGDTAQAEFSLNEMIILQPANNYALLNLGNIHVQQGSYHRAVDEYSKIIEHNPENTAVKIKRADVLIKMDRPAEAKKELEQIRAEHKNVDTVYIKKRILDTELIIKDKTNTSGHPLTATQKSSYNLATGNLAEAQREAAKALSASPQNTIAKNNFIEAVLTKPDSEEQKAQELKEKNITRQDIQSAINTNAILKYKVDSNQINRILKKNN